MLDNIKLTSFHLRVTRNKRTRMVKLNIKTPIRNGQRFSRGFIHKGIRYQVAVTWVYEHDPESGAFTGYLNDLAHRALERVTAVVEPCAYSISAVRTNLNRRPRVIPSNLDKLNASLRKPRNG